MTDFWECGECGETENGISDAACLACEAPRPAAAPAEAGRYAGIKVGRILEVFAKDKLRLLLVDLGAGEPLRVVTNAVNVNEGKLVVVATVGSTVPDGKGGELTVAKATVGGAVSEGMLCDGVMLGWRGASAGLAALLPESFKPGDTPPESKPRLDG